MTNQQTQFRRVCVYCGSSAGVDDIYATAAKALAHALVRNGIGLVYGGASVGIMGIIADATLAAGGEVHGVIPTVLQRRELMHHGLTDMHITDSMHERKALMNQLSDGFIALPGGFGTLEELFEILTWAHLGIHAKPIGILNTGGYYDELLAFLRRTVNQGFTRPRQLDQLIVESDPENLIVRLAAVHRLEPPAAR